MSMSALMAAHDYSKNPSVPAHEKVIVLQALISSGLLGDERVFTVSDRIIETARQSLSEEYPYITTDHVCVALDKFAMRSGHRWVNLDAATPPSIPAFKRVRLSRAVVEDVFLRDEHRCRACGSERELTIDHIVPVSRGGTNVEENLQTLCRPCNSRKGAR